jgi:hypothetical protein
MKTFISPSIAATPSYFFTPPQAGHNFFFSELLRSLVQKRKAEELNAAMKSKIASKKPRKPVYHYQKPLEPEWKRQKLNNESQVKVTADVNENESPNVNENSQDSVINVDKDDSTPAPPTSLSNTVPPPNASAFYPYVDPLHFFIDLRVSAGQYDRKKEAYLQQALKNNNILLDSNTWVNPIIGKNRTGSAFKVPESINNFSAINLVNNENSPKFYPKKNSEDGGESDKNEEDVEVFEVEVKQDQKSE